MKKNKYKRERENLKIKDYRISFQGPLIANNHKMIVIMIM